MYSDLITCLCLGVLTFILSMVIAVSQVIQIVKTKNTSGIALPTYLLFLTGGAICLAWALSYYFKVLYSRAPEGTDPSIIPSGDYAYGPYWLWQWGIIPLIGYYIFDVILSSSLTILKIIHMKKARQLKMSEIDLADYLLKEQKQKLAKSKYKLFHRKYFWMVVYLVLVATAVGLFMPLFGKFVQPQYNPNFDKTKWIFVMVLGCVGAVVFEAISWPQFIMCLKKKDTSGISIIWAIFLPVAMSVSFGYALALALAPGGTGFPPDTFGALIFNGLIVNYGVLVLKIINAVRAKKAGLSEIEYTKKHIIPMVAKKQAAKKAKKQKRA